jgi:hypothetical protein
MDTNSIHTYQDRNFMSVPQLNKRVIRVSSLWVLASLPVATALAQERAADPFANPWCSGMDIARNPGGCSDFAKAILVSADGGRLQKAVAAKIASSWTNLVRSFILAETQFTAEENRANDAILMRIQGALLAIGFGPVPGSTAIAKPEYLSQLIPNTSALERYLERKRRENPQVKVFRTLHTHSKLLAEQVKFTARTVSVKALRARE